LKTGLYYPFPFIENKIVLSIEKPQMKVIKFSDRPKKIISQSTFPKEFFQMATSHGYFSMWQLPKCAISPVCLGRAQRSSRGLT